MKHRPNRYCIAARRGNEKLTLADDGSFRHAPARPLLFKQARSAAVYWRENKIELDPEYEVYVQGPRGGKYELNLYDGWNVRRIY